ncbi:MAG: alpha-galactosidase [Chitinivibrionales bacterium]|nr:alpha-galactosidase [Chitinivibrionales bacterium]
MSAPRKPSNVRVPLESLNLDDMTAGWGEPQVNKSVEEKPLTVNGTVYHRGVGTHAESDFVVALGGRALAFSALVGVDDEALPMGNGTVRFMVYADGRLVADSGVVKARQDVVSLRADLTGAQELKLLAIDEINGTHCAHADWIEPDIELADGHTELPVLPEKELRILPEPDYKPLRPSTPVVTHPRVIGGTPGRELVFRIPATGQGQLRFAAENLPATLTLDERTGVIRGTVPSRGRHDIRVTVCGEAGECTETLTVVAGANALAQTPPMGWNSWNVWGLSVDQQKVEAAARALVETGLAAHGYQYVNVDDGWQAGRAPDGTILPNEKFPDMKGLAEYIHSLGLRFGTYSSPGPKTCGGYTGSYEHEAQDARTYAEWGVDFLKHDWCSYESIAADHSVPELQKPYRVMQEALAGADRDIVYSLCQYGRGKVWEWGAKVGAQMWRTTGDIVDTWSSVRAIGFRQDQASPYAGAGHWNDPDMLVLGHVGWGPATHATRLNRHEQITHMSLWCLLAAPLLIGCDLTALDEWTLAVLTNPEAIAIDQDPLGVQATKVKVDRFLQAWSRPLADGSLAVGLFNHGRGAHVNTVTWQELGIDGPHTVRDLWLHEDLGEHDGSFAADVAGHGAVLVKISPCG